MFKPLLPSSSPWEHVRCKAHAQIARRERSKLITKNMIISRSERASSFPTTLLSIEGQSMNSFARDTKPFQSLIKLLGPGSDILNGFSMASVGRFGPDWLGVERADSPRTIRPDYELPYHYIFRIFDSFNSVSIYSSCNSE